MSAIPRLLSWGDQLDELRTIDHGHVEYVESGVAFWMAINDERRRPAGDSFSEMLSALPDSSRRRWMTAPQVYRQLVYPLMTTSDDAAVFVADSLAAERALATGVSRLDHPAWTALGDACVAGGASADRASGADPVAVVSHRAPTVAGGIPVDCASPFCRLDADARFGTVRPYSAAESGPVVDRLRAAVTAIERVSPEAAAMIGLVTKVIVCGRTRDEEGAFSSLSWSALIGQTALINAHGRGLSTARLANALIHEAIHALLFIIDASEPAGIDAIDEALGTTVTSPWSGRALPPSAYIHACFVWFGLWCFWRRAQDCAAFDAADVDRLLARAASGFIGPSLASPFTRAPAPIAADVLDAIEHTQHTVAADRVPFAAGDHV